MTPRPSPTPLPGAQNFHRWGSITLFNGLPSDSVRAIAQTQDGVMWFGTDNGLARFDGRRVQKFSFDPADANRITALKTDTTGRLWIGTENGAFVYSADGFQAVDGAQGVGVTAILLGEDVFFGTDSGLVLRVAPREGGSLSAERLFPDPVSADGGTVRITSLIENDGKLIVGTRERGSFVVDAATTSELSIAPKPVAVNSLARSRTGKLWFGTDAAKGISGIYLAANGSRPVRVGAPTADVLSLEANESGLWAGTERYGLFHFADSKLTKTYTFENTSGGLRSDTIFTIFTDREGVIWVGTNRGVSRFDRLGPFQQTVSDIPNSNFIRTLFRTADGHTYAGSNRGLFVLEGDNWANVPKYGTQPIFALGETESGKLLVGSAERGTHPQNEGVDVIEARAFARFQGRTFSAVGGSGLHEMLPGGEVVIRPDGSYTALLSVKDRLWIGTEGNGLFSFDGHTIKPEIGPDSLKVGMVRRIFNSADGNLWIAGQHGIFRCNDGQCEQIINVEDARDVVESGGHIWAATTTRGLLHARRDEQLGWLVSSVGFEQGMPSEKAFSILPSPDRMVVATNRGVVTYRPGTIPPKLIPIRALSQRLHDLAELRSTVQLDYPQNSLLIEVAGQSSRTFPEEFQYAFLLKNGRGDIIDGRISNDPQYAPANLSPGGYTIESRAFDRDLNSSEPLIIRFSVAKAPFPWTATALGVLLVLSLLALLWAVVERRRIKQRNSELAAARLNLADEAERERRRIARDLHDQTLADLRKLMMKSDGLAADNSGFRSEIEGVSTEIRRICEDLSPSVLENVGLVAALESLLNRTVENKHFAADEAVEERMDFPMNVQLQIYRIAQEVLTNIERHSNTALVEMTAEVSANGEFVMTIRDDGQPFRPAGSNGTGRGIANVRSRANLIHARIGWSERRKGGNVFSLRIARRPGDQPVA
ncbi:MAG: two-component regulator propeller domain-containing protein [Acidobacteriota bacterium]